MSLDTTINPNLILKATETDLYEEYIDETFWDALAVDSALEQDEGGTAHESVISRKSKTLKVGAKYIEFGVTRQLEEEGTDDGEVLSGNEEPIDQNDNAVFFTSLRHGVPFPLKDLEAHYLEAFNLMEQRRRLLATWNGKVAEQWHWQAMAHGCPDKVAAKHGSLSPQSWHPNIYTLDASSVTKVVWDASDAAYQLAIDTAISAQAPGDNVSAENFWRMEVVAADNQLRKIPFTINGTTESLWLWVYPRAARVRIRTELKDFFLQGDVRGPNNNALKGDKFKFGNFLFCESAYIPRIGETGGGTISLQESWAYNSSTGKREDQRTSTKGLVHNILGADSLCMAEPNSLEYDFERKDYKRKEGIGTYRMFGSRRGESFDDRTNVTEVLNQSSILVIEYNG